MDSKKTNLSEHDSSTVPSGEALRIAVITAEWNSNITFSMEQGACETLRHYGVKEENIVRLRVPGTYELSSAANMVLTSDQRADCVICIGCVIQGETRHFEFICQAVSQGLTNVSLKHNKPVIFSVLTTDTMEQAEARSGGKHGNKGIEGALTALKMCELQKQIERK